MWGISLTYFFVDMKVESKAVFLFKKSLYILQNVCKIRSCNGHCGSFY